MSWLTYSGFALPPCLPCCEEEPEGCGCVYPYPDLFNPFENLAEAQAFISDDVYSCNGVITYHSDSVLNSASAGFLTPNQISFDGDVTGNGLDTAIDFSSSISLPDSSTLTIALNISLSGSNPSDPIIRVFVDLIDCATLEDVDSYFSGDIFASAFSDSVVFTSIPEGQYIIKCHAEAFIGFEPNLISSFSVSSSQMLVNPITAIYDDSGTIRKIEACPKFLLPLLTEDSGNWFADETAAEDFITNFTNACVGVGISESNNPLSSFSASGGGSLVLTGEGLPAESFTMAGSINAEAGETLTITYSLGAIPAGTSAVTFLIFDYDGALVESIPGTGSPVTSAALPYTGRYTVVCAVTISPVDPDTDYATLTATFTSSGIITTNSIQALYDVGISCPERLNCS